jgi:arylsulfatase
MSKRPNILFIMPDQQRADMLGSYGDPAAKTPNTNRLAAQGVQFEQCYCQAPLCMPSRASMLTERYVRDHGVFQNSSVVQPTVPTFVQALRDGGYHTAQVGKTHLYTHLPWRSGQHMNERRKVLEDYGFVETHEIAGKEATLRVDSIYTDYLREHGLLDSYRSYLASRNKHTLEENPDLSPARAWNADPLPLPLHAHMDVWLGGYAANWIRSYDGDEPFFLQVGFGGPHDPWDAPVEALEAYGDPEITMPGTLNAPEIPESGPLCVFLSVLTNYCDTETMTPEAIRTARRAYYANMMMIDESIGKILVALEERGELDNTWVVYVSDHGEMMGEHRMVKKMVFYDPSVRVPMIVRPPGGSAPRKVDDLVELFDISATFRAIAGVPMPTSHARSLLPAFDGASVARDVAISEAYGVAMFRTATEKLVVYEDTGEPMQYFDLVADPLEDHNLVGTGAADDRIEVMLTRYARPFLSIRPIRPHRSMIERGSMAKNTFHLPETVFVE